MKKVVLSTVVAMALATSSFAWGLPSVPGVGSSQDVKNPLTQQEIGAVYKAANTGEKFLRVSTLSLTEVFLGSKAKEHIESTMNDNKQSKDSGEIKSKNAATIKSAGADVNAFLASEKGKEAIKNLSTEQKKVAGIAIGTFAAAGIADVIAIKLAKDVAQKAKSDPMGSAIKFASELSNVTSLLSSIPTQATDIATMSKTLFAIAKTGGVPVPEMTDATVLKEADKASDSYN